MRSGSRASRKPKQGSSISRRGRAPLAPVPFRRGVPSAKGARPLPVIIASMPRKLDITVAAIAERSGRFLFVQERAARRVVLNQPAGHLEPGESLAEAVVRETLEETGCAFKPDSVTGIYLWQ